MKIYLRCFYKDGTDHIAFAKPYKQMKNAQDMAELCLRNELIEKTELFTYNEKGEEETIKSVLRA